eukprot:c16687_g1_i3.p1 GENE.c16687_g1_i3~~c16687_g1_i3.p1  ORF type:complete len:179 (+),score=34.10 c16687_g1_i3:334-870(+)
MVIGRVVEKHADNYRLDIGSATTASLNTIAFEGATKRNRPNIEIGALVYCRVTVADKDLEPEVSCISLTNKHGWMTDQAMFGELKGGYAITVNQELVRILTAPECLILSVLGTHFPFEITVGMNGVVWLNSSTEVSTLVAARAIQASQDIRDIEELKALTSKLVHESGARASAAEDDE